jgi:hypothetical protein
MKPMHYDICLSGEIDNMAQITANVTLQVNPATTGGGLAFAANLNLQPETEGVNDPGQVLGTVSGGTAPYTFSATGVPSGDTLSQQPSADGKPGDVDVVISGTPATGDAAGSPYTIALTITDAAGATATAAMKRSVIPVRR